MIITDGSHIIDSNDKRGDNHKQYIVSFNYTINGDIVVYANDIHIVKNYFTEIGLPKYRLPFGFHDGSINVVNNKPLSILTEETWENAKEV